MKKRILALVLSMMMITSSFTVNAEELGDISVLGESGITLLTGEDDAALDDEEGRQSDSEGEASISGDDEETPDSSDEIVDDETASGEETEEITEEEVVEDISGNSVVEETAPLHVSESDVQEFFTDEWLSEHNMTWTEDGLIEYVDENGQMWVLNPEDPEFWKYFVEETGEEIGFGDEDVEEEELLGAGGVYKDPFTCSLTGKKYSYPNYHKTSSDVDRVPVRYGVDVSKYQGTISKANWQKMKNDYGVDFAFIRAGFRGYGSSGSLNKDETFAGNINNAYNAGVRVGIYFFSQAITTAEAKEEADYCLSIVGSNVSLATLPIIIDYEYTGPDTARLRAANLTKQQHTNIVNAFCSEIRARGYDAGIYANKSMFTSDMVFSDINGNNTIWLAHWPSLNDGVYSTNFTGRLQCWQFTDAFTGFGTSGTGYMINDKVDLDFWFGLFPGEVPEPVIGTLKFEANGGSGTMPAITAEVRESVKVPECGFSREGGTFKEWNTKANGTGTSYAPGDDFTFTQKEHKLYAIWNFIEYRLTFDPQGGEMDDTEIIVYFDGKPLGTLPIPVRDEYVFLGWYTASVDGVLITSSSALPAAADLKLYAHWEKVVPMTISLSYDRIELEEGKTKTIMASFSPRSAEMPVTWVSSDESVAKVAGGTVAAVGRGKATVTARTSDGLLSASCDVTVIGSDIKNDTGVVDEGFETPDGIWLAGFESSFTYSGSKVTQQFKVYYGNKLLQAGTDYSVTYKNNLNAGVATAVVQGKGNFAGKVTKTFVIKPMSLEGKDVNISVITTNKGKAVKPTVTVTHDGKVLKQGKDFRLDYDTGITEAGTYDITVEGIGNYKGTFYRTFTVREAATLNISKAAILYLQKSYAFDELPEDGVPEGIALSYNKEEVDRSEYTLRVEKGKAVGKATLVITATEAGRFVGTKKVSFNITGAKLGSIMLSDTGYVYNGIKQAPGYVVYSGKKGEGNEIDSDCYSISYSADGQKAGTITVTATGIASKGYSGKVTAKYRIAPLNVASAISEGAIDVKVPASVAYVQGGVTPEPLVTFTDGAGKKWTLRNGVDYTVKYANNKSCTSTKAPALTITGKGNFTGKSDEISFAINKRSIAALPINCKDIAANPKKKGSYYYSKPVIIDANGKALKEKTDYTVTYTKASGEAIGKSEVLQEGTAIRATIVAAGKNYTGAAYVFYRVVSGPRDIASASVVKIANRMYTGKPVEIGDLKLTYTTTVGKTKVVDELVEGRDFCITGYYNNTKKGTASLRVEGMGGYCGSRIITFKIVASQVSADDVWYGAYQGGSLVKE
jgi:uncharacterized repeat protein (TIGR02543 family)